MHLNDGECTWLGVGSATIKVRAKHRLCFLFHPHYHHLEPIMVIFEWKYLFLLLVRLRSKHQLFLALGLLMHVSKYLWWQGQIVLSATKLVLVKRNKRPSKAQWPVLGTRLLPLDLQERPVANGQWPSLRLSNRNHFPLSFLYALTAKKNVWTGCLKLPFLFLLWPPLEKVGKAKLKGDQHFSYFVSLKLCLL